MTPPTRVGTRRSLLARRQTQLVIDALGSTDASLRFETVPLATSGDRPGASGAPADFTDALDRALLDGTIDLAVHSAKDLPIQSDPRLHLAACPPRADPRDALLVGGEVPTAALAPGARVGSSSPRRRAQLLRWRPDLRVVELRGNVDTRLDRLAQGEVDALVLAMAGLLRLGRPGVVARPLGRAEFLPAPGQGALAVVVRAGDEAAERTVRAIDHAPTHRAVLGERAFARELGADCRHPVAALGATRGGRFSLTGELLSPDGRRRMRATRRGPPTEAARVGAEAALALQRRGSAALLAAPA